MLIHELLTYLFDGQPHILSTPMETWLRTSRRFAAFVTTFRDKIRKKIRVTKDPETLYDLRLELETAYLLLQEKSLSLVYEPPCGQGRCPDFAVSFTTSLTFMVEVTRLRTIQIGTVLPESDPLTEAICSKLGQLPPQQSNVLIVGVDVPYVSPTDLQATMLRLQRRAERNDPTFWQRYRFRDRADFFHHYRRLSEVIVRGSQLQTDQSIIGWSNPQAKYPLPSKVRTALYHSHAV
ncbi:MAG TPA: hypothetical protein VK909_13950 [Anaerolineales bacterium]|nr:hypothetical protein [Anaerolineales bacterium]